jgi:uracil-DNA glycosylase family 4
MDVTGLEFNSYAEELFPPTESWEITAQFKGVTVQQLLYEAMFRPTQLKIIDVPGKGVKPDIRTDVTVIPGHEWMGNYGPSDAEVMIVGKHPGQEELRFGKNFVGQSGDELRKALNLTGIDYSRFFITNVVKFLPPATGGKLPARYIADCGTLLAHEVLSMTKLKYILLLGADAIKVFFGKKATLSNTRGAILKFIPHQGFGQFPEMLSSDTLTKLTNSSTISVMTALHPAHILHKPEKAPAFRQDIARFASVVSGSQKSYFVHPEEKSNYQYIQDADTLNALVDKLIAEGHKTFAMDCEWGGEHYMTGWLRTVQFSWAPNEAAVVILRNCESQRDPVFQPSIFSAVEALRRLIDRDGVKIWGQLFRSDAPWLESLGLPVMRHFAFDVGQADHALNESQEHDLTAIALRYTNKGRYDIDLVQWTKNNKCPDGGYGAIPDHILHPYAAADADVVMCAAPVIQELLNKPENAAVKELYYKTILPANQGIHEIEMNGVFIDPDRMVDLLWKYTDKKQEILDRLRTMISWPDFNPRSPVQKGKLLFGKVEDGGFGLMPVKTTEKPAREWDRILAEPPEVQARVRPSTDAESLDILSLNAVSEHQTAAIETLQDFQRIDQMTKNFLRPPGGADLDMEHEHIDYDPALFVEGLVGHIMSDGCIHTSISQLKETGRWSTRRPQLQNWSKRMESYYKMIMGDDIAPLRSCIVAPPGHVLIESDFKSAEIVVLAFISGDPQLIADATGPIKLHAKVAVDVFKAPSDYKKVSKTHPHLYVAAKNINFGIPYQRGAKAIARQILRETKGKVRMSVEEVKEMIAGWYARYGGVTGYIEWCKYRVNNPPFYIQNPWGRRRHFHLSDIPATMAAQEREAINYDIQSTVAGALDRAVYNLWAYRKMNGMRYKLILGIHDAVLAAVPYDEVEHYMDVALPTCMVYGATVPASEISPSFRIDIDPEIMFRWSEQPKREQLAKTGIPERFWPAA